MKRLEKAMSDFEEELITLFIITVVEKILSEKN